MSFLTSIKKWFQSEPVDENGYLSDDESSPSDLVQVCIDTQNYKECGIYVDKLVKKEMSSDMKHSTKTVISHISKLLLTKVVNRPECEDIRLLFTTLVNHKVHTIKDAFKIRELLIRSVISVDYLCITQPSDDLTILKGCLQKMLNNYVLL
jgi:hypothetical protein